MATKYVIIGGSAAGPKTASKIRRMDPEGEITMIQKGKFLSMASCGYPYFVGGVFDDPNMLIATPTGAQRDPSFFMNVKNIKALTSTEATAINREKKTVVLKNLETGKNSEIPYDKLFLATGANAIMPPLPGKDLEGVKTVQSMEDAIYLKDRLKNDDIKKAIIVGGGLIGIETCEALELGGVDITVVEMQDQILGFLDWEMAKHVETHLKAKGGKVITGVGVTEFVGKDGKITGAKLSDGRTLECDLAVVSIGVKPNSKLASEAGLATGQIGGIAVNTFMQTSDPSIFAGGDCVEVTNLVTHNKAHWPMGDAANLQGRVAAQNMVLGNCVEYEGMIGTGICKVFDYTAGSTGLSEKQAAKLGYTNIMTAIQAAPDKPGFMGASPIIIKLVADKTTCRLLGMQAVGTGDVSKRIAIGAMAIHGKMRVYDLVNLDLPYAPPFSPAIDNFITAAHVLQNKCLGRMEGISSLEVKAQLDAGDKPFLLDVRGADEFEQMRIGIGEKLIPLGALRKKAEELPEDKTAEIIVYCKISLRGYEAYCTLKGMGYTNVKVMEGGVIAWPFGREK
ncbi:MAG: FAD-dependent oxidoreductase [Spirochaetales bacterium]|uniref:FAD-dependent oxidoreductase n=1 Tax=Candidatus Thalassospirochaeta sargassi TaxID=3119039 RepID=A0AAJ1IKP8_9SPIO|nr:FAD-dependent oxidoreductase [Spirochaetales bacterium]